jgi:hypothetical protein
MTIHQHQKEMQAGTEPTNSRTHIEKLRARAAPLDMTGCRFRALGHDLVDRIADFLASIRSHPVTRAEPNTSREQLFSPPSVRRSGICFPRAHVRRRKSRTKRKAG